MSTLSSKLTDYANDKDDFYVGSLATQAQKLEQQLAAAEQREAELQRVLRYYSRTVGSGPQFAKEILAKVEQMKGGVK